jgi:hypothetical protein
MNKKTEQEETAEQRMKRARQWVEAVIKHTGGTDPIVGFSPHNEEWFIAFGPNMDFMPGVLPDPPWELFREIVDVCYELGRMDATGRPLLDHRASIVPPSMAEIGNP